MHVEAGIVELLRTGVRFPSRPPSTLAVRTLDSMVEGVCYQTPLLDNASRPTGYTGGR